MTYPSSAPVCRQRLSDLIRQAVPETDPDRRQALLVMADHWGELLRLRTQQPDDHQRRPSSRQSIRSWP
ncbi:MAG: hypothetical protein ACOH1H_00050 [Brevundimonas sp.]